MFLELGHPPAPCSNEPGEWWDGAQRGIGDVGDSARGSASYRHDDMYMELKQGERW